MSRSADDRRQRELRSAITAEQREALTNMHFEALKRLKETTSSKMRSLSRLSFKSASLDCNGDDDEDLRPCQKAYLAPSIANRLFRRSANANKAAHDDPIYTEHAENMKGKPKQHDISVIPSSPPATAYSDVRSLRSRRSNVSSVRRTEDDDRFDLLDSINDERALDNIAPLSLNRVLSEELKIYIQHLRQYERQQGDGSASPSPDGRATTPRTMTTLYATASADGSRSVRLVSPPGLGALACCSLWAKGRYHGSHDPSPLGTPQSELGDTNHELTLAVRQTDNGHAVFETLVDTTLASVGIAQSEDGCWVAEFVGRPRMPVWRAEDAAAMDERVSRGRREQSASSTSLLASMVTHPHHHEEVEQDMRRPEYSRIASSIYHEGPWGDGHRLSTISSLYPGEQEDEEEKEQNIAPANLHTQTKMGKRRSAAMMPAF